MSIVVSVGCLLLSKTSERGGVERFGRALCLNVDWRVSTQPE